MSSPTKVFEEDPTYIVRHAEILGIYESIILNDLFRCHRHAFLANKTIHIQGMDGEWFSYTGAMCRARTAIPEKKAGKYLRSLAKCTVIKCVIYGMPPHRQVQINYQVIEENLGL